MFFYHEITKIIIYYIIIICVYSSPQARYSEFESKCDGKLAIPYVSEQDVPVSISDLRRLKEARKGFFVAIVFVKR